jgi:4-hydroxybenzoate polyprenyltransferase
VAGYAPLIAVFTFSSVAYSRLLRGTPGFIPWDRFAVGVFTALVAFFWLRVLDEHKDAAHDRATRPELPVPRGLITLAELRGIAMPGLVAALALNALVAPVMLWAGLAIALWAALMTKEFFAPAWLRRHPTAYLISHMAILPMIDGYTTGLDWLAGGSGPPRGLWFFLVVTFLNGSVMEIGRKLRAPKDEREGVATYTGAWGRRAAPFVWLAVLTSSGVVAWLAAHHTGAGPATAALVLLCGGLAAFSGFRFFRQPTGAAARRVEAASGFWTLALYLLLGAGPFAVRGLR